MSDAIPKANRCPLQPPEKMPLPQRKPRFALRTTYYDGARNDAYTDAGPIEYTDQHERLMATNAAYRTFHYISLIFGAHDERTPERYRGGLKKIVER